MSVPDRTGELCVEKPNSKAVDVLLANRAVVIKNIFDGEDFAAAAAVYKLRKRLMIARRLAIRIVEHTSGDKNRVRAWLEPGAVEAPVPNLPLIYRAVSRGIEKMSAVNDALFEDERLIRLYGGRKGINLATFCPAFPHVTGDQAFPLHQDSVGVTGIGYAAQPLDSVWTTWDHADSLEAIRPSYTFRTEANDLVALLQRVGPMPETIPQDYGVTQFAEDGSLIHSGEYEGSERRWHFGGFHQEVPHIDIPIQTTNLK